MYSLDSHYEIQNKECRMHRTENKITKYKIKQIIASINITKKERERERQNSGAAVKGQRMRRPRCVHKCTQSGEQTVSRAETQFAGKSSKSSRAGRSRARKWSVVVRARRFALPPLVFAPRPPRIFKTRRNPRRGNSRASSRRLFISRFRQPPTFFSSARDPAHR